MLQVEELVLGNCFVCGASPEFHLQNPFGVRWTMNSLVDGEYYGWNNVPPGVVVNDCSEFVHDHGKSYDHDMLFMYISRTKM